DFACAARRHYLADARPVHAVHRPTGPPAVHLDSARGQHGPRGLVVSPGPSRPRRHGCVGGNLHSGPGRHGRDRADLDDDGSAAEPGGRASDRNSIGALGGDTRPIVRKVRFAMVIVAVAVFVVLLAAAAAWTVAQPLVVSPRRIAVAAVEPDRL